ncbi:MAG: DUF4388 domain-containing protein [Desulfobacteraceae bacterium]|nr:DUF4388 domain-containing protein [Desulfobacteraceae bacterium]
MSIRGNLETFDLSALLQVLAWEQKTGKLLIRSKTNLVQIFFQDGDIVFATESRKNNRLGQLLFNNGLISRQALDECLATSRKKNQFIGKTLVEGGYISVKQLNEFLLKQAENTIYNVFLWQEGEFEYNDAELNIKSMAGKRFSTMNILLEASRRVDELEVLKKRMPDDQAVLRLCKPDEKNRKEELSADERLALSMLNGNITIRQVIDQTGFDDFTGYKVVNSLISYGLVEIVKNIPGEKLAEQSLDLLQGIDGRQFRETLDHMGLKRTSLLRASLLRIFRDAADIGRLLESVREESGRLCECPEKAELARLKDQTPQPFMKNILELLSFHSEQGHCIHKGADRIS